LKPVTPRDHAEVRAIAVSPLDVHLLDAVVRVVRPLITREIIYRLLVGEQEPASVTWRSWAATPPPSPERSNDSAETSISPCALSSSRELGMSVSGLHHHFKAVTAMNPSQFQKRLRLLEARRLLLGEDLDAASAAYRVGYHDASHFNREYKSLFGVPPMRDMQRLREAAQDRAGR